MKKLVGYFDDVDDIMEALEKEGAFDEEDGSEDEIQEAEET